MASPRGQRGLEALWRVRGDAKSLPRPRAQRSSTCHGCSGGSTMALSRVLHLAPRDVPQSAPASPSPTSPRQPVRLMGP